MADWQSDYHKKVLAPLLGGRIIEVGADEEGFPFVIVESGGTIYGCWFSMDGEQNGPGCPVVEKQRVVKA